MIAIYARQSVDKKDSISIETQIEKCGEGKVYSDKGYSGKNIQRPDFERLLADIEAGLIREVRCYRLDRISRNLLDFTSLINFFDKHNCSFVSVTENLDTSTPMGRAMVYIVMVFAQLERETIAERVKDSFYARASLGSHVAGKPPIGYMSGKGSINGKSMSVLKIDPATKHIIERVFHNYTVDLMSMMAIAKQYNSEGFLTPQGKAWSTTCIQRILTNPVYAENTPELYDYFLSRGYNIINSPDDYDGKRGCLLIGRITGDKNSRVRHSVEEQIVIVGQHKPIIPADVFIDAQERIRHNKGRKRGIGKTSWLTGLVKCANCGYAATVRTTPYKDYTYYVCSGYRHYGETVCTVKKGHRITTLEKLVERELFAKIESMDFTVPDRPEENIKAQQEIAKIDAEISNLVDSLAEGSPAKDYIIKKIEALDAKKKSIVVVPSTRKTVKTADDIKRHWHDWDIKKKNAAAATFIESVLLSENGIRIRWL